MNPVAIEVEARGVPTINSLRLDAATVTQLRDCIKLRDIYALMAAQIHSYSGRVLRGIATGRPVILAYIAFVFASCTSSGIPTPTYVAQAEWAIVLSIVGATGAVLGFEDTITFTTVGQEHIFVWDGNPVFQSVNGLPTVILNGIDQGATSPDDPYWSVGRGSVDSPFSLVVWVKPDPGSGSGNIFGKYLIGGPNPYYMSLGGFKRREWLLQLESSDSVIGVLRQDSTNGGLKPRWSGLPPKGQWWMLALTYDGSGDIARTNLWYNAKPVKNGQTLYDNYVAMEDTKAPVLVGYSMIEGQPAQFFKGEMAGGFCGPIFTKKELNQADLEGLYGLCSPYLN